MKWFEQLGFPARGRTAAEAMPASAHPYGARGGALRAPVAAPPAPDIAEAPATEPPPGGPDADHVPPDSPPAPNPERTSDMSTDISATADIAGFIGACLVDSDSGLMLTSEGGGGRLDLEAAAALNTQVVKAKRQAMEVLGLDDHIDDILITLGKQLHMIRPLEKAPALFLYVALDKKAANLGMARMQVRKIEGGLSL